MRSDTIANLQVLTTLPFIATSTTFLENRITPYEEFTNRLYPSMKTYNYQEFIYAQ